MTDHGPADHILHGQMSSEGYWHYTLTCLPTGTHVSYTEKSKGCECECVWCKDDDHGGCVNSEGIYIDGMGYDCQLDQNKECWVHDWLDHSGDECIYGDNWPLDCLPAPVVCHYADGLEIHYAPPATAQRPDGCEVEQ